MEMIAEVSRCGTWPKGKPLRRSLAVIRWGIILVALVVVLAPDVGRASTEEASSVDFGTLSVESDAATARLENGASARLTIQPKLQALSQKLLARSRPIEGAALLVDAKSGKLLVLAEISTKGRAPGSVLLSARAPAASLFKLVTTTALLEKAHITPSYSVCTFGGNHGIERRHLDKPKKGRSVCSPFGLALGHSRNAVYAQLATHHLTRDDLMQTARNLGFNQRAPFDSTALVGTLDLPFNDLEFARASAGFRGSTLSPIGAAYLANVIAHQGVATRLRVVEESGSYQAPDTADVVGRVMRASTAQALMRMMEVTVREGTSKDAFLDANGKTFLPNIRVAGKTGTLQPSSKGPTTSWFTGFAPSRSPEVIVTVMLQNGKVWHEKANEVARDLLRGYFHERGRSGVGDPLVKEPGPERQAQR
jgi:peptidoglycan glycosyltransferase